MENQVDAINNLVSVWKKQAQRTSFPYGDLFQQAIADFQAFSHEYQGYFEDLISSQSFDPEKTTAMRLQYKYMQTLQGYWLALEQVILQWQVEYYCSALEQAYRQAISLVQKLDIPVPGILIYFNKVSNIRYLPFTRIPILGISHLFSGPERWSAISHEIGHYLFWNLGNNLSETRKLQKQLKADATQFLSESKIAKKQQEFIITWLEEIFCDIVGTRIDGLGFVKSSEEFLRSQAGNKNERTLNDGHHPPVMLRPFVWRHALRVGGKDINLLPLEQVNPAIKIKFCSPAIFDHGREPHAIKVPDDKDFETLSVRELLPGIETLVNFLYEKLDGILSNTQLKERKETAFQELKGYLEEEQRTAKKLKKQEIYELLLQPRSFEGGDTHTHGYSIPFHGWHEVTTHSH